MGAELFYADRRTDGRTDGHDEANSRFSQFCKQAWKLIKYPNMICDDGKKPRAFSVDGTFTRVKVTLFEKKLHGFSLEIWINVISCPVFGDSPVSLQQFKFQFYCLLKAGSKYFVF